MTDSFKFKVGGTDITVVPVLIGIALLWGLIVEGFKKKPAQANVGTSSSCGCGH